MADRENKRSAGYIGVAKYTTKNIIANSKVSGKSARIDEFGNVWLCSEIIYWDNNDKPKTKPVWIEVKELIDCEMVSAKQENFE